ncbi:hypothetical protein CBF27_12330 [Vagococcus acidifermentans]|uniref:Major facilitator superfamily (MFS) profile domain-containing protein n=1 Tax=Vagococcus acidifermentans TaxID=564710 RepID=A0A430ANG8_9ENTE|nr:hypothetical protein CBF27_12330 [Vagococcus acidifermentans]
MARRYERGGKNVNSTQQKSNIKLKIAILSVAAVAMANAFISPALAEIAKAFPEVSMTNIQLIMTFAMLGQFPFTLITGILGNRINNKILVLLGLISLIIGGILPYFLNKSITFLYIGSAFMGVGQGILLTMLSTIISKYFSGEERSQMFGWQNSFTNGGNMIMALIGGFLASTLWKNVYLATILCIPSLLLVLFWLPSEKEDSEKTTIKEKGSTIALSAIPVVILMLVFAIGFATIILNSAMLINDKGLGGADIAGLMVSLSGLVSVGGGLLYKYVMRISKSFILCVGALCLASGLFIGYFSSQIVIYFIGSALVYLGFTFGFSGCMWTGYTGLDNKNKVCKL